ncbi:response regulator [Halobaculum sp. WSA2]|uniref:histidine kinase n=1 Tax=Halobaculum saliterrae TaxID=2073113 RepID=A0A6B0SP86_9EURY|nr:response regulator [Halobaculum saliterrae]MXR40535.1 response regulator [Halobaculum saliterrae]
MSVIDGGRDSAIRILHVDDEPEFGDLVQTFLQREDDDFEVITETSARDGLARLQSDSIDCIVSDHDMPEMNGLEFLNSVRGPYPEIPFILFTGKGSEEVASEAISKGVTDYLQKGGGTDQYDVLANRIRNSVDQFRTQHELERSRQFLDRVLSLSPAAVVVLDGNGGIIRANELAETTLGLSEAIITTRNFKDADWEIVDADGNPVPDDALPFQQVLDTGEPVYDVEHGIRRPDGEIVWLSINAAPLWEDADSIEHVIAVLSDESAKLDHERAQAQTIRQLESFGDVLSHDLGNILNIAQGRLALARETGEDEHFEPAERSLTRAVAMLKELTTAIKAGTLVDEVNAVDASAVFADAWESQETKQATKDVQGPIHITANKTALVRLFENLIRNSLEHGTETVTIRLGVLPNGFYVEDDGPGIAEDDRQTVFEAGYTTKESGTGTGLTSVHQIALAHGWKVRAIEGTDGGARFEFTNVERPASG